MIQAGIEQGIVEAVTIGVLHEGLTVALTVRQIAGAVALPFCDVLTSAVVHRAGAVAHPTSIVGAITIVPSVIVADAVAIRIGFARSIADPNGVQFADAGVFVVTHAIAVRIGRAITIAVALWNGNAAAFIDRPRPIADAAFIGFSDASIGVITNAIAVGVFRAPTTAVSKRIDRVALAVTSIRGYVSAPALEHFARTATNAARIQLQTTAIVHRGILIIIAGRRVIASQCCTAPFGGAITRHEHFALISRRKPRPGFPVPIQQITLLYPFRNQAFNRMILFEQILIQDGQLLNAEDGTVLVFLSPKWGRTEGKRQQEDASFGFGKHGESVKDLQSRISQPTQWNVLG